MNGHDLDLRLQDVGLDRPAFAEFAGWSPHTVRQWGDHRPVPRPARVILTLLERQTRQDHPLPQPD